MGSMLWPASEQPMHEVEVSSFHMMKCPVTQRDYEKFAVLTQVILLATLAGQLKVFHGLMLSYFVINGVSRMDWNLFMKYQNMKLL